MFYAPALIFLGFIPSTYPRAKFPWEIRSARVVRFCNKSCVASPEHARGELWERQASVGKCGGGCVKRPPYGEGGVIYAQSRHCSPDLKAACTFHGTQCVENDFLMPSQPRFIKQVIVSRKLWYPRRKIFYFNSLQLKCNSFVIELLIWFA